MKGPPGVGTAGAARRPGRHRLRGRIGLVSVAALFLLVAVAPTVSATTITPPFKGSLASITTNLFAQGCAVGKFPSFPHWSTKTASGGWATTGSAHTCPNTGGLGGGGNMFNWAEIQLAVPIVLSAGIHSVRPTFHVNFSGTETTTVGGKCPKPVLDSNGNGYIACYAIAEFYIQGYGGLIDQTNGSYTPVSYYFPSQYNSTRQVNDTYCSRFTCSWSNSSGGAPSTFSGTITYAPYLNLTAVKAHHYVLVFAFSGGATVEVAELPRSSASAGFNLATGGKILQLSSITVT